MERASLTQKWDNMAVTTFGRRGPAMVKQTIDTHPLLAEVAVEPITSGMWRIEVPLEIGRNSAGGYLTSADGRVEIVDQDVASMAVYRPSLLAVPVKFNRIEKIQNAGKEQFKSLMVLKSNQAMRSMKEIVAANLFGKGDNFKTIGLGASVPTDPATTSVGGVPVSHKYWRSLSRPNFGSWAANGHLGSANDYLFNGYLYVTTDGEDDVFIVSDFNSYERYHRSLGAAVRYINDDGPTSVLNKGRRLSYQGRPWYADRKCDPDTILMLHRNDFQWHVAQGMNFEPTEMLPIDGHPLSSYMALILFHQWVPVRRNRNMRFSGIQN